MILDRMEKELIDSVLEELEEISISDVKKAEIADCIREIISYYNVDGPEWNIEGK